jgi:hypothetical protein
MSVGNKSVRGVDVVVILVVKDVVALIWILMIVIK